MNVENLKSGDSAIIYRDRKNSENPEGYAKLIKCVARLAFVQIWLVRFEGEFVNRVRPIRNNRINGINRYGLDFSTMKKGARVSHKGDDVEYFFQEFNPETGIVTVVRGATVYEGTKDYFSGFRGSKATPPVVVDLLKMKAV